MGKDSVLKDKDLIWNRFEKTGRVQDYLLYRLCSSSPTMDCKREKDDNYSRKFNKVDS